MVGILPVQIYTNQYPQVKMYFTNPLHNFRVTRHVFFGNEACPA
jgi:hypothetical protein